VSKFTIKNESGIYKRDSYTIKDIDYIIGKHIIEYDMKDAGFNLIKYYRLLPESEIKRLEKLKKYTRKIQIGLIRRDDKVFNKSLARCFELMRRKFIKANNIQDCNILSIKHDAIFTVGKNCSNTKFKNVEFIPKHKYTSFHRFNNIEMYFNSITKNLDVKGINDEDLKKHKKYMLSILQEIFYMLELSPHDDFVKNMKDFIKMYKERKLHVGYYRELNSDNSFTLSQEWNVSDYYIIGLDVIDKKDKDKLNINYNYINYIFPILQRHYYMNI
jgi:hypothetical protein